MKTFSFTAIIYFTSLLCYYPSNNCLKKYPENRIKPAQTARIIVKQRVSTMVNIKIRDLSPKFLSFYNEAARLNLSENERWLLWKKRYDFAAVPPTPQGDSIARKLLNNAWPRYPEVVNELNKGNLIGQPYPVTILTSITQLLKPGKPVQITFLSYKGGFEDNAFTNATKMGITVAIPRESPQLTRELLMTHEFTHAVQISMGYLKGGYIRTIGAIVVSEGLATRLTQKLHPELGEGSFIEITPGWLRKCRDHQTEILNDIRKHLSSEDQNDIMRYTMGKSDLSIEREAYYTGWLVIKHWLSKGMSFAEIARIPEKNMLSQSITAIDEILKYSK